MTIGLTETALLTAAVVQRPELALPWLIVIAVTAGVVAFFLGRQLETLFHYWHTIPIEDGGMAATEVQALRLRVAAREHCQALANELQTEWEYGLHKLLNADVDTIKKWARYDWERKEKEWRERVLGIMERYGCTPKELSDVRNLHLVPIRLQRSPEHGINEVLNAVLLRLDRIAEIIDEPVPVSWTSGRPDQAAMRVSCSRTSAGVLWPCRSMSQPRL
jgi:hypothetical protein